MAERRNLTVNLDGETIRRAKILAASRGTSVSKLIAELVQELVENDRAYEIAKRAALGHLEKGYRLGGRITSTRDEWHER
jgi:hypothetical protein